MSRSQALVGALLLLLVASCGSSKQSSAPTSSAQSTTTSQPSPITPAPSTSTGAVPRRCAPYSELALINHSIVAIQQQMQSDWPQFQKKLAVAFARNRTLYLEVAADTSGALRADALLVAAYMPRSRTVLLRSASFDAYRAALAQLSGGAAIRDAVTALNGDTARSCPAETTPTTSG